MAEMTMSDPMQAGWLRDYFKWVDTVTKLYGKPPSMRDRTLYFIAEIQKQHREIHDAFPERALEENHA